MSDIQRYSPEPIADVSAVLPDEGDWQEPRPQPSRSQIGRMLAALLRYRWLLIAGFVLGTGGAAVAWKTVQLDYLAQGSLWVNVGGGAESGGPISEGGLLESLNWLNLIKSFTVLDPVVVGQRMYLDYDPQDTKLFESFRIAEGARFRAGKYELKVAADGRSYTLLTGAGTTMESGSAGDSIGVRYGFGWQPPTSELTPDRDVSFDLLTPRDASVRLRDALVSTMDPRLGTFIQLSLRNRDATRAAGVLKAVMDGTVEAARDLKSSKLDETNRVLSEQLAVVETDLRNAERELESFRVNTITLPTDKGSALAPGLQQTQSNVLAEFFRLRLDLEDVRRDRERLENVLASAQDSTAELRITGLELIPTAQASSQLTAYLGELASARAELRKLRERFTDQFLAVQDASARVHELERVSIPQAIEALVAELRQREDQLGGMLAGRTVELEDIPPRMIEEARLERRVEIATRLYTELRQRAETSSLAARSSVPDLQILDVPAVPVVPQGDTRVKMSLMVFGALFGLGVGLAVLLDRMDPKVRDPFDVTGDLGLPILGAVPHLKASTPTSEAQVREAFRELRINVEYAHGPVRPLVVCITSPSEKEGKSFVSTNLAMAFAGLRRRTLLVDGDTRRGNSHELLGLDRKPGLTDFLLTSHGSPANIQPSSHDYLSLLSSGSRHQGSPELLNSSSMQTLMAAAKKRFDVIILDSPPLSAGADALMLAAHAGSLAIVIRNGTTNKALTMVKIEPLLRLPVRILGAVINDFSGGRLYGSYRYYGDYLPGYEAMDEEVESVPPPVPTPPALTS